MIAAPLTTDDAAMFEHDNLKTLNPDFAEAEIAPFSIVGESHVGVGVRSPKSSILPRPFIDVVLGVVVEAEQSPIISPKLPGGRHRTSVFFLSSPIGFNPHTADFLTSSAIVWPSSWCGQDPESRSNPLRNSGKPVSASMINCHKLMDEFTRKDSHSLS